MTVNLSTTGLWCLAMYAGLPIDFIPTFGPHYYVDMVVLLRLQDDYRVLYIATTLQGY